MRMMRFEGPPKLYDAARKAVEDVAAGAIAERGRFTIALSGGSTPLPLYERLVDAARIDWARTHVFWSDERCVPPDDRLSNARATHECLLAHVPVQTEHVHRIDGIGRPPRAADAYEVVVRKELSGDRFDLILLGLGTDGHTASLFPRHQALGEDERWILPVHVNAEPPWRVTMTLPLINRARHVVVLAVGDEKLTAAIRIERGEDLPAGRVRPTDGDAAWMIAANR